MATFETEDLNSKCMLSAPLSLAFGVRECGPLKCPKQHVCVSVFIPERSIFCHYLAFKNLIKLQVITTITLYFKMPSD